VGQIIQLSGSHYPISENRSSRGQHEFVFQNLELFPREVCRIDPPRIGVDSLCLALADDGCQYMVKSARTKSYLPLNEWLCYHLAEGCGIAVPTAKVLRMPDKELVFGSRWAGGVYTSRGFTNTPDQLIRRLSVPGQLWAIFALDLFIQNFDRRIANLLFQEVDAKTSLLAIDFSRALLYHQVPFGAPAAIPRDCATLELARFATNLIRPSFSDCERVLNALNQVTGRHLCEWISRAPSEWQAVPNLQELLLWWDSDQKGLRIDAIKEGLWNGAFV
jgi:hypothetical protein